jgi:hypothetical protein
MSHGDVLQAVFADVLEVYFASIFRVVTEGRMEAGAWPTYGE